MKSEIKTQNISTKKLKFVAEIFLADLRIYINIHDTGNMQNCGGKIITDNRYCKLGKINPELNRKPKIKLYHKYMVALYFEQIAGDIPYRVIN